MKKHVVRSIAALTLVCCEWVTAAGQISYQTSQFGYRVYGQTLAPPQSMFFGGVPTTAARLFQVPSQSNVWNNLATPWRRSYQSVIDPGFLALPSPPLTFQSQSPAGLAPVSQGAFQPQPQYGIAPTLPGVVAPTPGVEVGPAATLPPPVQPTGIASGAATGPGWKYAAGHNINGAAFLRADSLVRSPELSALLTRIARTRGMLAGPAIDVYLSGDTAVMQGVVRSAAHRTVLRNVLGLDPNVSRIDDRLVVRGR